MESLRHRPTNGLSFLAKVLASMHGSIHRTFVGSTVHARMLHRIGILTADEVAVDRKDARRRSNPNSQREHCRFEPSWKISTCTSSKRLIDRSGDVGRKLHTARSRNDQVSTDLRLWVRDGLDRIDRLLLELQRAFLNRCDIDVGVILPAYTHLQRAQPVFAPHYWLAYIEKLARDRTRLRDCRRR